MGGRQSTSKDSGDTADSSEHENKVSDSEEGVYAGLEAIRRACGEIYPDQRHLVVSATIKTWLGGPDPLDHVYMYSNNGDPEKGITPHWHYVSSGFSDLHGDGRVHPFHGPDQPSGFGFELTLRLKKKDNEDIPPTWPAGLMNKLANYIFQTGNVLHVGDHIPLHHRLDGVEDSQSLVHHILIAKDPQLPELTSPYGHLDFRQLVGVTDDEMKAAQKWKGAGVLELMADTNEIGPFLITDIERSKSIFDIDKMLMQQVDDGINTDGSDLGYLTSICMWTDLNASQDAPKDLKDENTGVIEDSGPKQLDGVHLLFHIEAAELLPLIVRGRLQKGRLFVFQNAGNQLIHLIPPNCHEEGVFVNQTEPLKAIGGSLQVYCSKSLIDKMTEEFECLSTGKQNSERDFRFSNPSILITVSPDGHFFGVSPSDRWGVNLTT